MPISRKAKKADTGLNHKAREILELLEEVKPLNECTVEGAREFSDSQDNPFELRPRKLASIQNMKIPGPGGNLSIRIYRPETQQSDPLPALVFYHGGGFVIGSINSHDTIAQNLSAEAHCTVFSVEYRLSPETKFPGALEDALAAFYWVTNNAEALEIRADKVAVGGDSAGGNLAAVTSLRCRDQGGPQPVFQLLIYPVTDFSGQTKSKLEFSQGFYLTKDLMDWFHGHYVQNEDQIRHPHVSPLLAKDHKGLPPARIITCGFDVLRDEGKAYADNLDAAGVDVVHSCYTDMMHGFISFGGFLAQGHAAIMECAAALQEAFAS